ncbi:MAG: glycoside hydrolase family 15 protein [Gammaproteobacteria bacterium]|jgi:glucoamylase
MTSRAEPESGRLHAPGTPGIEPAWTSSDKDLVGCALGPVRLWFTIGHGIVNEVYYPRIDIPQIRDLGFIVADGKGFWVEVKRLDRRTARLAKPGIPAFEVTHEHPRFALQLRICPDPKRDVLLLEVRLDGDDGLMPYVLLAPHLGGSGRDNTGWATRYRGRNILWAEQGPFGLALLASDDRQQDALVRTSAGYAGCSDGWQDFARSGALTRCYGTAGPGNIALTGQLPRTSVLALGLASSKEAGATLAASALKQSFDTAWQTHCRAWDIWHAESSRHLPSGFSLPDTLEKQFRTSAMVLRSHMDRTFPGAMVASLSIPWGNRGEERGGYHLVWPRDLVECAGALLALGAIEDARDVLCYLAATQLEDGHWFQNQWLGGKPHWSGVQLDEVAFPVLLAVALAERNALDHIDVSDMVRRALGFIARNGPASDQDRWEENTGVNTFTLATCIAALAGGSCFLDKPERTLALRLADYWNANIEHWTVARATRLAHKYGVRGYYVRVSPVQALQDSHALARILPVRNRLKEPELPAAEQIGVDFLQLVRFGLRCADDPHVLATLTVTDALLRVDTPQGPAWHRYNGDGYGERDDGSAFNGAGIGRAWPLLSGERGHFELAAGHDPLPYLESMAAMTSGLGMLPEQVWDAPPIPTRGLQPGRPTGSAMPLAWAHAEFIKLAVSHCMKRIFDRPDAVWRRYHGKTPVARHAFWTPRAPVAIIDTHQSLVVLLPEAAIVHTGVNDWQDIRDLPTTPGAFGLHRVEIDTGRCENVRNIDFTWRRSDGQWHGRDFSVAISRLTEHTHAPLQPDLPPVTVEDMRTHA